MLTGGLSDQDLHQEPLERLETDVDYVFPTNMSFISRSNTTP